MIIFLSKQCTCKKCELDFSVFLCYFKTMKIIKIVLITISIIVIIYFLIPKYQIVSDSEKIYKLNKLTGTIDIIRYTTSSKPLKPLKKF